MSSRDLIQPVDGNGSLVMLVERLYRVAERYESSRLPSRLPSGCSRATKCGGGRGIRTPEGLHLSGFQDHRHRPLGHPSGDQQMIRSISFLGPRIDACPDSR
jgi:hypothetical protein